MSSLSSENPKERGRERERRQFSSCPARARSKLPIPSYCKMKVVAAYLLAVLGGNANPSAKDLKVILGSVGAEAEDNMIELLLSGVKGKDITELFAHGREKFAAVPSGGGGAIAVAAVAGGSTAAPATAAAESKKEEKVEEKEESDDDMGFSLFD